MKKTISVLIVVSLLLAGCARSRVICGTEYEPYGILTEADKKNPDIEYDVVWGNVVWGFIFLETVIVPAYFLGFSLFEPVGLKSKIKGAAYHPSQCPAKT